MDVWDRKYRYGIKNENAINNGVGNVKNQIRIYQSANHRSTADHWHSTAVG
jgi:hypothetical protein